jgi:phenylpyruvate tautomerase PptA (4-oxalocrotonate tautomerase family)
MPFVRIDIPQDLSDSQAAAVSQAVHGALVEVFNVPADDRFQVVARHPAGAIVCSPQYLGIRHSDRVAFVQIDCAPGRTVAQKEVLYHRIASGVAQAGGFKPEDVVIHLVETLRENWSFGNGIAQYAVQDRTPPAALRAPS